MYPEAGKDLAVEFLKNIREAEIQAENIVNDARINARDIVKGAHEKAALLEKDMEREVGKEKERLFSDARARAEAVVREARIEKQKEREALKASAARNMSKVADYIVRGLVNRWR